MSEGAVPWTSFSRESEQGGPAFLLKLRRYLCSCHLCVSIPTTKGGGIKLQKFGTGQEQGGQGSVG